MITTLHSGLQQPKHAKLDWYITSTFLPFSPFDVYRHLYFQEQVVTVR